MTMALAARRRRVPVERFGRPTVASAFAGERVSGTISDDGYLMAGNEATAFEYAMGLFSVVIGLAVADIAISLHRLLRRRRTVQWDFLALAAAAYTFCMAVYMWFDIWGVRHFGGTRHFFFFLALVVQLFILFLAAAASLPDDADSLDLRAYYDENRRYFWMLLLLFQLGYSMIGLYFLGSDVAHAPLWLAILMLALMTAPIVVCVALLLAKSRAVHAIGIAILFALMVLHYAPAQIN